MSPLFRRAVIFLAMLAALGAALHLQHIDFDQGKHAASHCCLCHTIVADAAPSAASPAPMAPISWLKPVPKQTRRFLNSCFVDGARAPPASSNA